ncbi:AraC family transcriptional regulator [Clostridium sediminicola]|uniref:AraC family transcriptional regulator n=1 Tax=Clostridium sediminicola TaxID=3114879 RepID=UPI0031F20D15
MIEKMKFNFNDLLKTCNTLSAVTKMDVRLIDKDGNPILQLVNHNLPAVLQNLENDYQNINDILRNNTITSYYYYINSYRLEYIASGIWENRSFHGFILIGPFISVIPSRDFITDIISNNKLPISERKQLQEFYQSLPVISGNDSNDIGDLLVNLCGHSHIDSELITSDIINPIINKEEIKTTIAESKNIIEYRYKYEKNLMNAISKGDNDEVNRILKETNTFFNFNDRIPESPIRSLKNLSLTSNSLFRVAAERGGVHPIYLHNISEKFAIMIERAPNLPYLKKLQTIMINEYCDVVRMFSTSNYSSIVKKAVDYINLNIQTNLSLKSIAEEIHVNPSHLSRQFKKDTNLTVIDYINQKRVDEAKLYLERGNISLTEIALMIGFSNLNYFSRVFKKITSITPSQYIKKIRQTDL